MSWRSTSGGDPVGAIEFGDRPVDGIAAAGGRLWVVHTDDDSVSVVDAGSEQVAFSIRAGDFPVAPVAAFGRLWVPALIDGTVTVIDIASDRRDEPERLSVATRAKNLMLVAGSRSGREVWISNLDGELTAVSAEPGSSGRVRTVDVGRSVNRVVALGDRAVVLPTWGLSALVLDLVTEDVIAEIALDSIPVRGIAAHGLIWVTSDGPQELLTVIDPESATMRAQYRVGDNRSDTNGPQQPFVVGDEIWVPNRGDSAMYIVDTDDVP